MTTAECCQNRKRIDPNTIRTTCNPHMGVEKNKSSIYRIYLPQWIEIRFTEGIGLFGHGLFLILTTTMTRISTAATTTNRTSTKTNPNEGTNTSICFEASNYKEDYSFPSRDIAIYGIVTLTKKHSGTKCMYINIYNTYSRKFKNQ